MTFPRPLVSLLLTAILSSSGGLSLAAEEDIPAKPAAGETSAKTVISSDRLEVSHTEAGNRFLFIGDVTIRGEDFTAECERMEVRTDSGGTDDFGAISVIEATGNVRISQGERIATAGKALIYPTEDKVVLEEGPVVRDGRGTVTGYRMILRGADRRISVEPGPDGTQPQVELPSMDAIRRTDSSE